MFFMFNIKLSTIILILFNVFIFSYIQLKGDKGNTSNAILFVTFSFRLIGFFNLKE
jgi:hypothetical protein